MSLPNLDRRGALVAALVTPLLARPFCEAEAATPASSGSRWTQLVAAYRAKRAHWLAMADAEDRATGAFFEARSAHPEPQSPPSNLPDDLHDMTIREIKASGNAPEHKAAWAAYEIEHAAWADRIAALRKAITSDAKARQVAAQEAYSAAFEELCAHRPASLAILSEKLGILSEEYAECDMPSGYLDEISADLRHLLGRA